MTPEELRQRLTEKSLADELEPATLFADPMGEEARPDLHVVPPAWPKGMSWDDRPDNSEVSLGAIAGLLAEWLPRSAKAVLKCANALERIADVLEGPDEQ